MTVETCVQRHQDVPSDLRINIAHTDCQELFDNVANDLGRVGTSLVNNRVLDKELTACEGGTLPDLRAIRFYVSNSNITNEFVEDVACKVETTERMQCQRDLSFSCCDDLRILVVACPALWRL